MPREQVAMRLEIEYDRALVTEQQHKAIQRIMRRAAAEVVAKGAALANPHVLSIEATEWNGSADTEMNLDWEQYNG